LADDKGTTAKKPAIPLSAPVVIAIIAVLLAGGAAAYLTFGPKPAPPPPPVLTQEAKDYLPNLKLSDVGLQAAESYINSSLVEILGKVGNVGNRGVKLVQVNCVFRNVYGQPIRRELATVVGKTGALKPGDTKPFRLAFDNPPPGWNQAMPDLVIAQIQFE
jgi:hypothetical protein